MGWLPGMPLATSGPWRWALDFLVVSVVAASGLLVSVLLARLALASVLAWTYSGTVRASSPPSGVRSRTPVSSREMST
jgi:hypothetical protein